MTIKQVRITIVVKDIDRSIAFYESIGWSVVRRWSQHDAQLTAAGFVINLHQTADIHFKGNSGHLWMGFSVDDYEEAKLLLRQLSIETTEMVETGGEYLIVRDPDGTDLYISKLRGKAKLTNCSGITKAR